MAQTYLCDSNEIATGKMKTFNVGGTSILVYNLKDGYYATQNLCSHTFAPLKFGKILKDKCIECPFHKARFDIRTGKVVDWANFPPGIQLLNVVRGKKALKTYKVTAKQGKLFVNL